MPADNTDPKQPRSPGRPFKPGQSGNPNGRPRGRRPLAYEALDRIGEANAQDIIDRVIQDAKDGDMRAAEIILRRAWPERKGRAVAIDLPQMVDAHGVIAALAAVTRAVATGNLTPDEGQAFVALLEAQRRAVETVDLAQRIEALERHKEPGR